MRSSLPAIAGVGVLMAVSTAGCASSTPGHPATATVTATTAAAASGPRGSASVGELEITDAYIPQPASPDVAAAYFTVTDVGSTGDVLLSATSTPASQTSLMQESDTGADAGTMTDLPGGLSVPPKGAVELGPGGYHLMLDNPVSALKQGQTVVLALRFKYAGTVTLKVPVTSLLSDAQTAAMPGM
ncbi:copper chaperone PCu(A)C [Actinospica sp. MGRD01-02]|uniref:Copper chaperone PCu(A)C n=1 Tax=Actinospica acidithermotolerans TaxID=2828514 RepID=A0A941E7T8_9ACTN|nr:copper chaperone PCu(A)C [Actinospica acidithermotolerans]MBR7825533.1 copper chaperone PCu(A)C [Actinospica acidithermotolerans]